MKMNRKYPALYPFIFLMMMIFCTYSQIWVGVILASVALLYVIWKESSSTLYLLIWFVLIFRVFFIISEQFQMIDNFVVQNEYCGFVKSVEKKEDVQKIILCVRKSSFIQLPIQIEVYTNQVLPIGTKEVRVKGEFLKFDSKMMYRGRDILFEKNAQNIIGKIQNADVEVLKVDKTLADRIYEKTEGLLKQNSSLERRFFSKLLLNKDGAYEESTYQTMGLAHILAISGLHIGVVIMGCSLFLKKIRKRMLEEVLIIVALLIYLWIINFPISACRAVAFYILLCVSRWICRRANTLNTLFVTGILFLLIRPGSMFDISFQLSFIAVFGIGYFYSKIDKLFCWKSQKIKGLLIISLISQFFILPLQLHYFGYVNILSPIWNMLFLPIFIPFIFIILFSWAIGLIIPFWGSTLFSVLGFFYTGLYSVMDILNEISSIFLIQSTLPGPLLIVVYWAFLIIIPRSEKYLKKPLFYSIVSFIIGLGAILITPTTQNWIYFLNVKQGDSAFIETPEKNIFIDLGGNRFQGENHYQNTIHSFLRAHEKLWIDGLYVSHYDEDHIGNMRYLLKDYVIKYIITVEEFPQTLLKDFIGQDISIPISSMERGMKQAWGNGTDIYCIWPPKFVSGVVQNANSMVLEVHMQNYKILFTGDITKEEEPFLFEKKQKYDIIKIAHHGSKDSTSPLFLEQVDGEYGIISVGKNNYGHPSLEVLERLKEKGIKILRTDELGEIGIRVDGELKFFFFSEDQELLYLLEKLKEPMIILIIILVLAFQFFLLRENIEYSKDERIQI